MKVVNLVTNSFVGSVYALENEYNVQKMDYVVIESERGLFLGQVINVFDKNIYDIEFNIVRKANNDDLKNFSKNETAAYNVLAETKKIADKLNLDMNFVDAVYSLDKKRLYLSFVSDNRIDFRELAKRLAQKYHARIEFRQIGVRDKAKKIGGIGPCGLMLCCNKFLNDFDSVSINMAKNQMLALNPNKINGVCGRLKCCLNYENEVYKENRKNLPKVGDFIQTSHEMGKVIDVNILNRVCKVELSNKSVITVEFGDLDGTIR